MQQNESPFTISFGLRYFLQIQVEEEWYEIDERVIYQNLGWFQARFICPPHQSRKRAVNWWERYGVLPNGTYRLVKPIVIYDATSLEDSEFRQIYLLAEFTI